MKNIKVNKLILVVMSMAMVFSINFAMLCPAVYAEHTDLADTEVQVPLAPGQESEDKVVDKSDDEAEDGMTDAAETVVGRPMRKEKRIAELTDKYNDAVYGKVAYYLEVAQKYSLPICFIGITMGAFNFLIVGNKKLDKKEQGYGWIVGFVIGLVVFNVLPLLFALFFAGRQ